MAIDFRKHEVNFCSRVSKWADKHFETHPELPFGSSEIEEYGRGTRKRADLRVYGRVPTGKGGLLIGGEVKLPGTPLGRSPFDPALMQDAFEKANRENCRYFFTWNVEELALFDRSIWDAPTMHDRLVGLWRLGVRLNRPSDISHADVERAIFSEFLPKVVADWGGILSGRRTGDFSLAPAEFYIAVLESHLTGPAGPLRELYDYLLLQCEKDKGFDSRLREWMVGQQWNFDRKDPESWHEAVERAAESMVYVLGNRILFYQAVRLRNRLPKLEIPAGAATPTRALLSLKKAFREAVDATGDYEPVFFPDADEDEWAALTALSGANSIEAWRQFIAAVEEFRFKEIPTDVLGGVYQKLISPEERHKFGQHYTDENIIDVINAFCIGRRAGPRRGDDVVLDPACGSGSFLVRAYYRKAHLDGLLSHEELLEQLYGCDINPFPAHLATLNLAARNITNKENYPRIARKNFFLIRRDSPHFCVLPKATRQASGERERQSIDLPELDAVVGNPPYVRQELIPKQKDKGVIKDSTKEYIAHAAELAFPELKLSGQTDLHTYFWPVATQFLKEGGWFGFLTSSSWLDVRYGFAVQEWVLRNFKLVAVLESVDEPWFEDARVKTAVTILQRCSDAAKRDANLVRFVRFKQPLAAILGERKDMDEEQKQQAAEELRKLILSKKSDYSTDQLRIVVKKQAALWQEGIALGEMFARQKAMAAALNDSGGDEEDEDGETIAEGAEQQEMHEGDYGGGKWGRYLRAPDFYFQIMREFGDKFVRLGDIATIKFGIKSGCDAFFMPHDVSNEMLEKYPSELEWSMAPFIRRPRRPEVASGEVLIVQAGDKTLHPIERKYTRTELHSLMNVDRPVVRAEDLDRVVLWVSEPLEEIKGTYAYDYIRWGEKRTFASKKSRAVPVPQRSTCKGRDPWYDLTGIEPGIGFWPKAQKYRHIIPGNPEKIDCNCNLYAIHLTEDLDREVVMAVLNSTLVALFKAFYGRYAGAEGTLKTEVIDALTVEIPSSALASPETRTKLAGALHRIEKRSVTHLVEQDFLECHTDTEMRRLRQQALGLPIELQQQDRRRLDLAVFELLGVSDAKRQQELVDRLYAETALYHREQRIQDIQSSINRSKNKGGRDAGQLELALDAWEQLEPAWRVPLPAWLRQSADAAKTVELPDGEVRLPAAENFLEATTLFFGKKPGRAHECTSRAEAELLYRIAGEGLRGPVSIPPGEADAGKLLAELEDRLAEGRRKLMRLAEERAGSEKLREQVVETLYRWFIHGKAQTADAASA